MAALAVASVVPRDRLRVGLQEALESQSQKTNPSSDWSLQLDSMKQESLVIVDQNATVNTFPGLVHTARHAMEVSSTQIEWPNLREGAR